MKLLDSISRWRLKRQRRQERLSDLATVRAMPPAWMHSALLTYQIKTLLGAYDV